MKIISFHIYGYSFKLNPAIYVRDRKLISREGYIVHLVSENGGEGFGEVSPLPGFSRESAAEALEQLQWLRSQLGNEFLPEKLLKLSGQFQDWLGKYSLKSSVRFGVECALIDALAGTYHWPMDRRVLNSSHSRVAVSGLLFGSDHQITDQAKRLLGQGFKEMKLKIGGDVAHAVATVRAVNEIIYGKAVLHLDVNQGWDFNTALQFGEEIGCAAVSYIEEPFSEVDRIPEFYDKTLIPVALDESVLKLRIEDIKSISGVETIILKPSVIGGIEKTWRMIQTAESCALDVVVSSAFESSLGMRSLINLAGASRHSPTAGLDTLKMFQGDVLKEPVKIVHGMMDIPSQRIQSDDVNFDVLTRIV